jgi:hypothetical protein
VIIIEQNIFNQDVWTQFESYAKAHTDNDLDNALRMLLLCHKTTDILIHKIVQLETELKAIREIKE